MRHVLPALLLAATRPAAAEPEPGFGTLDRYGGPSAAGAALTWLNVDAPDEGGMRIEAWGQYLVPNGLGGYAAGSWARSTADEGSTNTFGNVEVGGLWASEHAPFRTVMRAGVVLATAGDDIEQEFANTQAIAARLTDWSHIPGNVTWLRLGMSPRHRMGEHFFRVDVGFDLPVAGDGKADANQLLRVNAAAGIATPTAAATFESVNLMAVDDVADGADRFLHTLAIGARYLRAGPVQPYLSLVLPLDGPGDTLLHWAAIVGTDWRL